MGMYLIYLMMQLTKNMNIVDLYLIFVEIYSISVNLNHLLRFQSNKKRVWGLILQTDRQTPSGPFQNKRWKKFSSSLSSTSGLFPFVFFHLISSESFYFFRIIHVEKIRMYMHMNIILFREMAKNAFVVAKKVACIRCSWKKFFLEF